MGGWAGAWVGGGEFNEESKAVKMDLVLFKGGSGVG